MVLPASAPAVAAIGDRLLDRFDELADELIGSIRQQESFYESGAVPLDDLSVSVRDNLRHILHRLAGRPTAGFEPARATGRRRAEQGAPLPAILHAYRVAWTFVWTAIVAEASTVELASAALLDTASELWLIVDELSGEVTAAYQQTVSELARRDEQTRNAMLDVLLRGDFGDGSRLWDSADSLRLPRQGTFVVVVVRPPASGLDLDNALRARGVRSVWRVELDAHVGVVALGPRTAVERVAGLLTDLTHGPVGISETYPGLDQTPAALRQARLAYASAGPAGVGVVRYSDVPVAVLIASAPDAAAGVARAVLGPVLALDPPERDVLLDTLRMWFAAEGATSAAALKLHVHRNTVQYRLRRLEELTGRSLIRPTGVAELHLALEVTRILHLQSESR
jgi:hypothetical protein